MNKLKLFLVALLAVVPIYLSSAPSAAALWNPFQTACDNSQPNNVCNDVGKQNGTTNNPISGPRGVIQEATTVFALITIIGGLIVMSYAAIVFVTAGGARAGDNSSRARNARTTIVSALTGIVIASLAWLIVTYVNTQIIH